MIPKSRLEGFHVGQIWQSSRGCYWMVVGVADGQAVLRQGYEGTGRLKYRAWDAVMGWVICADPLYSVNAFTQTPS